MYILPTSFARIRCLVLMLSVLTAVIACQADGGERSDAGAPVVLAASSLQESMSEVADAFAAGGHERPVLSFTATSSLARQIESGAPADIFIAADEEWMDALGKEGMLAAGSRFPLLTNSLVVITPIGGTADGTGALGGAGRIAMADPLAVPAGRYSKAALERLGWWADVEPRIVPAENVRAALALVERGEVTAGIVYATDAQASQRVRIAYRFAEESHPPIIYPAALLSTSRSGQARAFLDFLKSEQAGRIFRKHGFGLAR